jgi:hypothetical protein
VAQVVGPEFKPQFELTHTHKNSVFTHTILSYQNFLSHTHTKKILIAKNCVLILQKIITHDSTEANS